MKEKLTRYKPEIVETVSGRKLMAKPWKITEQDLQEKERIDKRYNKLTLKFLRFIVHLAEDIDKWIEELQNDDGDIYYYTDVFFSFGTKRRNTVSSVREYGSNPEVYDLNSVRILKHSVLFYEKNRFDNQNDGVLIPTKYVLNYDLLKDDYFKYIKKHCKTRENNNDHR